MGTILPPQLVPSENLQHTGWPVGLPDDAVQPWEELDGDGHVIPAGKSVNGINQNSDLTTGAARFSSGGSVTDNGDASRLTSVSGGSAWAMYRIPLGGEQPGVVSVDANSLDGEGYFVGVSRYAVDRWDWHGPFTDNHVRISTAGPGPWTSALGNLFVTVLVHGGAASDVVGIGTDALDVLDSTAPGQPTGLSATPLAASLLLSWDAVIAGDLAGYRIYHSDRSFINGNSAGVRQVDSLEGLTEHQLILNSDGPRYMRVSAVDISGNESALSDIVSATHLPGTAPALKLAISQPSGGLNEAVTLTAQGADSYDFDLDGDGIYDITADTLGTAQVDTGALGIIRPAVRATGSSGTAIALGAVSLIISGNSRPVAVANSDTASGTAPLTVNFSGTDSTDFDGSVVGGGWDFDGDGTYDVWDDTDIVHVAAASFEYAMPGTYNAKLRVVDDSGAWDVDTLAITVSPLDPGNNPPTADLQADTVSGNAPLNVNFDASASDAGGDAGDSIKEYAWDWDGNGAFEESGSSATVAHLFSLAGSYEVGLRVTDQGGKQAMDTTSISVNALPTAVLILQPDVVEKGEAMIMNGALSSDSDGSIVLYEWDTDGDGSFETNGGSLSNLPDLSFATPGFRNLALRVTDDSGAMATAGAALRVNGWAAAIVVENSGNVGLHSSLAVVNGAPAISYYYADSGDLRYVRAQDTTGATWAAPVDVDVPGNTGQHTSLKVVNGKPAISFYSAFPTELRYVQATDTDGTTWGTPVVVSSANNPGMYNSLAIVNGNPAISFYSESNGNLLFVRAADADGASWNSPVDVDTAGDTGTYTSMAVVNGNPAISYYDEDAKDLRYVRSADADGTSWNTPVTVEAATDAGRYTSLLVVNGRPAISYSDDDGLQLSYVRATDASGTAWDSPVAVDTGNVCWYTSLLVVKGRPVISYYYGGGANLRYAEAMDANGVTWVEPLTLETAGIAGQHSSLAIVSGSPAISFYGNSSSLRFVRYQP